MSAPEKIGASYTLPTREQAEWYARGMLDERANAVGAFEKLVDGFEKLPLPMLELLGSGGYRFFPLSQKQRDKYLGGGETGRCKIFKKIIYLGSSDPYNIVHEAFHGWHKEYSSAHGIGPFGLFNNDPDLMLEAKKLTKYGSTNDFEAIAESGRIFLGVPAGYDPPSVRLKGNMYDIRAYGDRIAPNVMRRYDDFMKSTKHLLDSRPPSQWHWEAGKKPPQPNRKNRWSQFNSTLSHFFGRREVSPGKNEPLAGMSESDAQSYLKKSFMDNNKNNQRPPPFKKGCVRVFRDKQWQLMNKIDMRGSTFLITDKPSLLVQATDFENGQERAEVAETFFMPEDLTRSGISLEAMKRASKLTIQNLELGYAHTLRFDGRKGTASLSETHEELPPYENPPPYEKYHPGLAELKAAKGKEGTVFRRMLPEELAKLQAGKVLPANLKGLKVVRMVPPEELAKLQKRKVVPAELKKGTVLRMVPSAQLAKLQKDKVLPAKLQEGTVFRTMPKRPHQGR